VRASPAPSCFGQARRSEVPGLLSRDPGWGRSTAALRRWPGAPGSGRLRAAGGCESPTLSSSCCLRHRKGERVGFGFGSPAGTAVGGPGRLIRRRSETTGSLLALWGPAPESGPVVFCRPGAETSVNGCALPMKRPISGTAVVLAGATSPAPPPAACAPRSTLTQHRPRPTTGRMRETASGQPDRLNRSASDETTHIGDSGPATVSPLDSPHHTQTSKRPRATTAAGRPSYLAR